MSAKHRNGRTKQIILSILAVPLFLLLSYGSIKAGVLAGNLLFNMDTDFIVSVDPDDFKTALNYSFPLINSVYNSGNMDISLVGDIQDLISGVFGFNLETPVTILSAQSPFMSSYYRNKYLPEQIEKMELAAQDEIKGSNINDTQPKDPAGTIPEDTSKPQTNTGTGTNVTVPDEQESTGLREAMSSWTWDGETEEKTPTPHVISKGKIQIQNEAGISIDIDKLLAESLKIKFQKSGPKVLIYHTHTTESFLKSLKEKNGSSWNSNPKYNVVRVGDELASQLKRKYGISVLHNGTVHNVPDQNKAYIASLQTLTSYLKSYPSLQITIDLHRDASNNGKLRLPVKINGKNAAQIMFVIATKHSNWKENLKLALKLQEKANDLYPGLAKPIWIAKDKRYNQHLRNGSITVEIGGDGNTLDEAVESAKLFARILNEAMKEIK